MEDGFGEKFKLNDGSNICLNPCCNGRWFRSSYLAIKRKEAEIVLILVVMEDGFGEEKRMQNLEPIISLNPCCNGRWFRRLWENQ